MCSSPTCLGKPSPGKRVLHHKHLICSVFIILLACLCGVALYQRSKEKWRFLVVITNVDILSGLMRSYVEYHQAFPPSLEALLKDSGNDQHSLDPYYGKIEYFPPSTTATGTSVVMVVTFKEKRIVMNKDFDRTFGDLKAIPRPE